MRDTCVRAISISASFRSSGGKRHRLVVDDLDRCAAAPEHHDRAEGRIVGEPSDKLARFGPAHHRLHGDADDSRAGLQPLGALEDVSRRLAHRFLAREVELDAADVGFVDDVRREDLHRDGAALGEDRTAPPLRPPPASAASVTGATGMS